MPTLALTSVTGKLGNATLRSLLDHNLISASELVLCTSSDPSDAKFKEFTDKGSVVRQMTYEDHAAMEKAFAGCEKLFLVSTPRIELDFNDAPPGEGREKVHIYAIEAARKAGVKHIYYTSLGFGDDSVCQIMTAHLRTEEYLKKNLSTESYTVIREGLYNESWPLYLGHFWKPKEDDRKELVIAGDGPINWTSISDLGLCSALILASDANKYAGQTITLSAPGPTTLKQVVGFVSEAKGEKISLKIVSTDEYEKYYVNERGMDVGQAKYVASAHNAFKRNEAKKDDSTLVDLLKSKGRSPEPIRDTVLRMVS